MSYSPQDHGALCKRCWLYNRHAGGPVPPEMHSGASVLIVGEAPGEDEVTVGRPFVGRSGHELFVSLGSQGYRRDQFSITNAILCRPPGNELARTEYQLKRENDRRKKMNRSLKPGEEPYELFLHPADACRPRLLQEVNLYPNVFALGGTAIKSITGSNHSPMKIRGSTLEGMMTLDEGFIPQELADITKLPADARRIRIMPTFHPALTLYYRRWTSTFRGDLARGMRWFHGRSGWRDPILNLHPTPEQLREFLTAGHPFYAWDLETDAKEPLIAKVRRFGVGTPEKVFVVPLRGTKDRFRRFYTENDEARIWTALREFLADPKILKMGWNSITYDAQVIETVAGIRTRRHLDGILMHHCVDSELPHKLGFVGTTLTDIVAWKQDSEDPINCTDEELTERNWKDVAVTARLKEPLEQALQLKNQVTVCRNDHRVQDICAGMHKVGMLVDPIARDKHDRFYLNEILVNLRILREVTGRADFKPLSYPQVGELLFEEWGLPPISLSEDTGAPSADDTALRTYITNFNLTKEQRRGIIALRKIRKASKYRGTNILKFRLPGDRVPEDEYTLDVEETDEERDYRRKKDLKKTGILLPDGRIHSSWKTHVAKTGRLASSDPAMQNWDRDLRDMIVAGPGHLLVGADEDQLELRYAAGLWRLERMLEIFKDPTRDPHSETGITIFGPKAVELYQRAEAWAQEHGPDGKRRQAKKHPEWSNIRDFAKNLRYACQYGAEDPKVHEMITGTEDKAGNLIYADKTLTETRTARRRLLDSDPYERGWEETIQQYRRQGYVAEAIWGRVRYFLDGEDFNEIVNFPIQAGCSSIVHDATFELIAEIPFERWGPGTGLIHQGHDALVVECPESEAKRVAKIMTECMTRTYPKFDVQFTAESKISRRWSEV